MNKPLTLACVLVAGTSFAQQLSSSVITSAGGPFLEANGALDWSLGEIMTETYTKSNGFFTQGFQQPAIVRVTSAEEKDNIVSVYPNPVREMLYVKLVEKGNYTFEIINMQGQKLYHQSATLMDEHIEEVAMGHLSAAIYLLRILNTSTGISSYYRIEKL